MHIQYKKVKRYLKLLYGEIITKRWDIDGILTLPCGYKTDNNLPCADEMSPYIMGSEFGSGWDSHAWFYFKVKVPKEMTGKPVRLYVYTDKEGWDAANPQFICYVDGVMRQGLDTNHTYVTLEGKDEYDIYLYAYTGAKIESARLFARLAGVDYDVEGLYYDIKVPFELSSFSQPSCSPSNTGGILQR